MLGCIAPSTAALVRGAELLRALSLPPPPLSWWGQGVSGSEAGTHKHMLYELGEVELRDFLRRRAVLHCSRRTTADVLIVSIGYRVWS